MLIDEFVPQYQFVGLIVGPFSALIRGRMLAVLRAECLAGE